jgi:NitT/TauT family transport system substrate-binding protein
VTASLVKAADSAFTAGFLKSKPDLSGIYDLGLLNDVLTAKGLKPVQ